MTLDPINSSAMHFSKMPRDVTLIREFKASFSDLLSAPSKISIAGRIVMQRVHKNIVFFDLSDGTSQVQVAVFEKDVSVSAFKDFKDSVAQGDIVYVEGLPYVTRAGEDSLRLQQFLILSKATTRPPTPKDGLQPDIRYLTLMTDIKSKTLLLARSRFFSEMRQQLWRYNYLEVETPILEKHPIGSAVRQFDSWHNSFGMKVYLRVTPELYHKKLLVAGFARVFEIGRVFRNEGISREHAQDYVAVEGYAAYMTYESGVNMLAEIMSRCAQAAYTEFQGGKIEHLSEPIKWKRTSFKTVLKNYFGIDVEFNEATRLIEVLEQANLNGFEGITGPSLVREVWRTLQASLIDPTIVEEMPSQFSPMGRPLENAPDFAYEAKFIVSGIEVGHAFDELTDPEVQKQRFISQSENLGRNLGLAEIEFLEALGYGLPPNFGFGFSERIVAILMDVSIKDVQYFPLYR